MLEGLQSIVRAGIQREGGMGNKAGEAARSYTTRDLGTHVGAMLDQLELVLSRS